MNQRKKNEMITQVKSNIAKLAKAFEAEYEAAYSLWTWLPSYKEASKHHGHHATNFIPSIDEIMTEASMVLAVQQHGGDVHSEEERNFWFTCPCDEHRPA